MLKNDKCSFCVPTFLQKQLNVHDVHEAAQQQNIRVGTGALFKKQ